MTIILIPKESAKPEDIENVSKSISRLIKMIKKIRTSGGDEPIFLTIDNFDVYAVPGDIVKMKESEDGKIYLDVNSLFSIESAYLNLNNESKQEEQKDD